MARPPVAVEELLARRTIREGILYGRLPRGTPRTPLLMVPRPTCSPAAYARSAAITTRALATGRSVTQTPLRLLH